MVSDNVGSPGRILYIYSLQHRGGDIFFTSIVNVILIMRLYAMYGNRKGKSNDVYGYYLLKPTVSAVLAFFVLLFICRCIRLYTRQTAE